MIDKNTRLLSICCTFRRPQTLKNMLKSWESTKSDNTEMFVYLHMDDPRLNEYMEFIQLYDHVVDVHRNLQEVINHVFFNLYPKVPYGQVITDDAVYHTKEWDNILIAEFERQSNGWGFVCGRDGANNDQWNICKHPSMEIWSRKQASLLGYVYPRNMEAMHLDYYTKSLGLAVNGLIHVPSVFIEHLWSGGCKKEPDQNIKEKYNPECLAKAQKQFDEWERTEKAIAVQKIQEAQKKEDLK